MRLRASLAAGERGGNTTSSSTFFSFWDHPLNKPLLSANHVSTSAKVKGLKKNR